MCIQIVSLVDAMEASMKYVCTDVGHTSANHTPYEYCPQMRGGLTAYERRLRETDPATMGEYELRDALQ